MSGAVAGPRLHVRGGDGPLSVREALLRSAEFLAAKGVLEARLDAEVLLAHALGCKRIDLFVAIDRPLERGERERARALVQRRARREPVAHITGEREFFSLPIAVTRDVLVPRPETELLADLAIRAAEEAGSGSGSGSGSGEEETEGAIIVADVCTGSGAVACAIARWAKARVSILACDRSEAALAVARDNVRRLGLERAVRVLEAGDLVQPLAGAGAAGRVAVLAANPPYVARSELASLEPEVRLHEPEIALVDPEAPDGLGISRRLAREALGVLCPGGAILIETGAGRAPALRAALEATGGYESIEAHRDAAGIERVVSARRKEPHQ